MVLPNVTTKFGLFGGFRALVTCRAVGPALCSLSISLRFLRKGSWWTECGWIRPDGICDAAVESSIPVPEQACNRKSQPEGKVGTQANLGTQWLC